MRLTEKAKAFATKAHEGQTRKTNGTPMIEHPIRVAKILQQAGFEEHVVAAGYLHDTVEDTDVTLEVIEETFGPLVAEVVEGNTENKDLSWEDRKRHTIESIRTAPLPIKALVVADKLDNLLSLVQSHKEMGEDVWKHFKRGKAHQKWYFTGVATHMKDGLDPHQIPPYFEIYEKTVDDFFHQ